MNTVKVLLYGAGAMGLEMVKVLTRKPGVRIVAAIDSDPSKVGQDLGKIAGLDAELGIMVSDDAAMTIGSCDANLALVATTAFADDVLPIITSLLEKRIHVVTICQELFFPIEGAVDVANQIDKMAKEVGVSVVAAGINPGFSLDILPVVGSLPCRQIDSVTASRIVDFSPYGPDEMRHIGAGTSQEEFNIGAEEGHIGHIGLLETVAMVAHCLGLHIDELRQIKKPIVANKDKETSFVKIPAGKVCGFKQTVQGLQGDRAVLDFTMIGLLDPREEDNEIFEMGNRIRIEGVPVVDIDVTEEISQKGGIGTAAVAVNLIPALMSAEAGFHTMNNLPLPHFWSEDSNIQPIKKVERYWKDDRLKRA